eukprot:scaffold26383_cov99-Isochrysis_galbana.AAC.1
MNRQILYSVAAMQEQPLVAVDERDCTLARRGAREARVVREESRLCRQRPHVNHRVAQLRGWAEHRQLDRMVARLVRPRERHLGGLAAPSRLAFRRRRPARCRRTDAHQCRRADDVILGGPTRDCGLRRAGAGRRGDLRRKRERQGATGRHARLASRTPARAIRIRGLVHIDSGRRRVCFGGGRGDCVGAPRR